jgi:hypothetical protein
MENPLTNYVIILLIIIHINNIGIIEAFLWNQGVHKYWLNINKHIFLLYNRFLPILLLILSGFTVAFSIGVALLIGSLHPSAYYLYRNKTDGAYKNHIFASPFDEDGKKHL